MTNRESFKSRAEVAEQARERTLGQVFTPPAVAKFMAGWVARGRPRRILDPSLGRGVFIQALRELDGRLPRGTRITACEVDPAMIEASAGACASMQVDVRREDFLGARFSDVFDGIVCNPPYIRHHESKRGEAMFRAFDRLAGERLSRLTNEYGLFLIRIWSLLAEGGRAAVIMPAEWLNADFGVAIKRHLLRENAIDAIIHFKHAADVFDGVLTTAAIAFLRRGRGDDETISFQTVDGAGELGRPARSIEYRVSALAPDSKWTPLFNPRVVVADGSVQLGDVARCTRGIATGANRFFVLKGSEVCAAGIDRRDVSVCVSKAAQVRGDRLTQRDVDRMIAGDERMFLLTPREPLAAAVARYLAAGRRDGIDRRYLPSHRPVWYRPEQREPGAIWVNVFARGSFRFIRNEAEALHLTCFHSIYPNAGIDAERLHSELCGATTQERIRSETRIYAAGLSKLEPRDVERIWINPVRLRSGRRKSSRRAGSSRRRAVPSCPD